MCEKYNDTIDLDYDDLNSGYEYGDIDYGDLDYCDVDYDEDSYEGFTSYSCCID